MTRSGSAFRQSVTSVLVAAGGLAVMVLMASCQPPPEQAPSPHLPTDPPETPTRKMELPTVPAEEILPLEAQRRMFEIVEGDERGQRMPMVLRPAAAGERGTWVLEMDDLTTLYLTRDEAGNVLIVRMDLPHEGYAVVYNPPVRLIPSTLHPELRVEEESQAQVLDLATGSLEQEGPALHTIRSVTRTRFDTLDGEQEGYMVVIEHSIKVRQADLSMELEAGYLPGEGMVYRRLRYTILRLGVFGSTTRRTAVVVDEGTGGR
jgi:hypothetical protein